MKLTGHETKIIQATNGQRCFILAEIGNVKNVISQPNGQ